VAHAGDAVRHLSADRHLAAAVNALTRFSLAHLTAIVLPPPELIRIAARAGFAEVGLRLIAVTADSPGYRLMDDPAGLDETRRAMADTGVGVDSIEFVRITPEIDVAALEPFVAVGAALGARHVITAPYDPELSRLSDRLAAIDALCERYRMSAVLEFFPWTEVASLGAAAAAVAATGRPSCGILVDTLHYARSASSAADFAALAPSRLPFVHVCDAPSGQSWTREALIHTAREARLPPGEGGIDIAGIVRRMPKGIPIALEVPMTAELLAEGAERVIRRVHDAAARLFERGGE
jgi:sugar phosphate isomerase/epimerase